ncbi:MAG: hypothetical protein ABW189_07605 [Rickettsiales bacterium]
MDQLLHNPLIWVALSGAIFIALVYKKVGVAAGSRLDARSDAIRKELDDALALKEEAKKFLADARQKQKNAEEKAKKIILHAREESARIVADAQARAEESIMQRNRAAEEKIAAYETEAIAEIRRNLVNIALMSVRDRLTERLNAQKIDPFIEPAIESISKKLH